MKNLKDVSISYGATSYKRCNLSHIENQAIFLFPMEVQPLEALIHGYLMPRT